MTPHHAAGLDRFIEAQRPVIAQVQAELAAGRKTSHWMWFVFPQLAALGRSRMARHFGLASLDEARAYAGHPMLGERLAHDTALVLQAAARTGRDLVAILGRPDDLKFRSCMTLFERADPTRTVWRDALERLCGGERDELTLERLR